MSDVDILIATLSAYMRKGMLVNEHNDSWENEEYGELIIATNEKKYEFLAELANLDATPNDIWNKAADVCSYVVFLADRAVKRKINEDVLSCRGR